MGMMRLGVAATCAVLGLSIAAHATEIPADLMHDGKPLDPLCFDFNEETAVSVKTCAQDPTVIPTEDTSALRPDTSGWIAYAYRLADLPEDAPMRGWTSWRYLGAVADGYVVETLNNGGGTGQFSTVETVRRDGDMLRLVKTHMGGDRCNGGVAAAAVADGVVVGAANITPYDLLDLAVDGEPPVQAYDDIAACAICCVGTAALVGDSVGWVSLTAQHEGFASEPDTPQACFDDLLAQQPATMDQVALRAFGQEFLKTCAPGTSGSAK